VKSFKVVWKFTRYGPGRPALQSRPLLTHPGLLRAETVEAKAEGIVAEELKRRKWTATDLQTRPKGDLGKLELAARLRAETTMSVGWIAERLGMGTRGYLNHLLYRRRKLRTDVYNDKYFLSSTTITRLRKSHFHSPTQPTLKLWYRMGCRIKMLIHGKYLQKLVIVANVLF